MASLKVALAADEQIVQRVAYLERQCQQFANLESAFERIEYLERKCQAFERLDKVERSFQHLEKEVQQIKICCNGQDFKEDRVQGVPTKGDSSADHVPGHSSEDHLMSQINQVASLDGMLSIR